MIFHYQEGQTPIDANETDGLIPPITTQTELNVFEEQNILAGRTWVMSKRVLNRFDPFSEDHLVELHRRMLADVWKWAGALRLRDKNIGVSYTQVRIHLRELMEDARYWAQEGTYDVAEIAVRVHHRLVKIHLFANGNGRHARLVADIIAKKGGISPLTWGAASHADPAQLRSAYIAALRKADEGDYADLLGFCKS